MFLRIFAVLAAFIFCGCVGEPDPIEPYSLGKDLMKSHLLIERGEELKAIHLLEFWLKKVPDSPRVRSTLASAYVSKSNVCLVDYIELAKSLFVAPDGPSNDNKKKRLMKYFDQQITEKKLRSVVRAYEAVDDVLIDLANFYDRVKMVPDLEDSDQVANFKQAESLFLDHIEFSQGDWLFGLLVKVTLIKHNLVTESYFQGVKGRPLTKNSVKEALYRIRRDVEDFFDLAVKAMPRRRPLRENQARVKEAFAQMDRLFEQLGLKPSEIDGLIRELL